MWCSACPIFSEFLCDNEKAFLLYVWTLGESYLNTIFWIFQMEFFAYICIALSFVLKKLNENQFFFEPVCRWLLWQLRRDSAKKLCGQHEENVGKYVSSIFRINLSELFALLIVPLFPQKWTSPFSDRIRREQALLASKTINNRQKGCEGVFWTMEVKM